MLVDDITVEVRDKALTRKGIIDPKYLDLKAVKRHLGVGEWHLTLPQEHKMVQTLWTPGSGIIITLHDKVWMSGPTNNPSFQAKAEDPVGSIIFSGADDNVLLSDATAWPLPSQPDVTLQIASHDVRVGLAETVMKQYVNANIGPGAPLARRGLLARQLTIETDGARGPAVTKSARFPVLGELLSEIGLYAGMGFQVVQVGSYLEFQVYLIRDQSTLIRFDIDNGSIEDETIQISAPTVTRPIVAGQGEQEDRQFIMRTSADSLQAEIDWGRKIEQFIDQRNTSVIDELNQAGDEALAESGFTATAVKAVPADDTTREYAKDWDIGDKVTITIQSQPAVATVTEASLVANKSGIAVAAAIGDVSGFNADSAMSGRVDDTVKRVSAIERATEIPAGGSMPPSSDMNNLDGNGEWVVDDPAVAHTLKHWPVEAIPRADKADANNAVATYRGAPVGRIKVVTSPTRVEQEAHLWFSATGSLRSPLIYRRFRGGDGITWSPWTTDRTLFGAPSAVDQSFIGLNTCPSRINPIDVLRTDFSGPFRVFSMDGVEWWRDGGSSIARINSPTWVYPTLINGWLPYSSAYANAAAIRTSAGIIVMRGLIKNPVNAGSIICNLPPGMRPAYQACFLGVDVNAVYGSYLAVMPNGDVVWRGNATASASWVNLEGIRFPAADVAPESAWTDATMNTADGWSVYDPTLAFPAPSYWQDGLGRVWWRGLAKRASNPATDSIICTHPSTLTPTQQIHQSVFASGAAFWASLHYGATYAGGNRDAIYWKPESPANSTGFVNLGDILMFPSAKFPDSAWPAFALAGGAAAYDTTKFPAPSLYRADDGIIHCRGLAKTLPSTANAPITATLNVNDRNAYYPMIFATSSNASLARINYGTSTSIGPDHTLLKGSGGTAWQSFDGIMWMAEG